MNKIRTYSPKASELEAHWHVEDASSKTLGRLATELSRRATGKTLYILDEPTTGLAFEDCVHLPQLAAAAFSELVTVYKTWQGPLIL